MRICRPASHRCLLVVCLSLLASCVFRQTGTRSAAVAVVALMKQLTKVHLSVGCVSWRLVGDVGEGMNVCLCVGCVEWQGRYRGGDYIVAVASFAFRGARARACVCVCVCALLAWGALTV